MEIGYRISEMAYLDAAHGPQALREFLPKPLRRHTTILEMLFQASEISLK